MFPLRDDRRIRAIPLVTWTLIALNVVIYVWDRGGIFGPSFHFEDLALRPREIVAAVLGKSDSYPLVTLFTSLFLHGGLLHLAGNMVFLAAFGPSVEEAMGPARMALYYLAWGVVAAFAQIWVDPLTGVPMLGASGAIGGVLGAYFLLFPSSKIEVVIPLLLFLSFEVFAWVLLGLWFLLQILSPQEGVANWAHIGGFLAGMTTVLVMGGRRSILKGREDLAA